LSVQILFFASLREAVGQEAIRLNITGGNYAQMRAAIIDQLAEAAAPLWAVRS